MVLLLEAPYKDGGPQEAALIDLLPLGHSSCSMLCRSSYLQCELPLPSSQATLQHPGSSTNCPHSVVAYAQRDVPMHSRPKLHAPATQVPRQDPASTTCPRARRPALRLVRSSTILPAASACHPKLHVPAPIPQQDAPAPPLTRSLVVLLRSIPCSQRELPLRVVRFHVRSSTRFYVLYCSTIPQRELSSASKSAPAPSSAMRGPCLPHARCPTLCP